MSSVGQGLGTCLSIHGWHHPPFLSSAWASDSSISTFFPAPRPQAQVGASMGPRRALGTGLLSGARCWFWRGKAAQDAPLGADSLLLGSRLTQTPGFSFRQGKGSSRAEGEARHHKPQRGADQEALVSPVTQSLRFLSGERSLAGG